MDILKIYSWDENLPENHTGIIEYNNTMVYYLKGKYHKEDGPSIIRKNGTMVYYLNGLRHKEDGPAAIYPDGTVFYYINDKDITEEVKDWIIENNIPEIWNNSHKILFKLTFG